MKKNQAFDILAASGGIRAARIITENKQKLSRLRVWTAARKLRHGMPVAKIIHQKWFYGLRFYTNRYTLDPRPDTETLVAAVVADCGPGCAPQILDLGTGTGCILISLIKNIAGARGTGVDVSWCAACVARKNVRDLGVADRIKILRRSYHRKNMPHAPFDIIVANPPYISHDDTRVDAGAMHDPARALYASDNGYAEYKIIAQNAHNWTRSGGRIYLEIGIDMEMRVREIFERAGWSFVRTEKDLSGIVRVLVFEKK